MKKLFKWILGIVGTFITLILILGIIAFFVFDSEDIKKQLVKQVKQSTTADLAISQELSLGFFPWLQIETGGVSLSQPANFKSDKPLLTIDDVAASIKLLPLISGDIEVGSVTLSGTEVNMITDSSGRSNFKAMMDAQGNKGAQAEESGSEKSATKQLSLESLSLTDVTFNQFDESRLSQSFQLKQFEVQNFKPEVSTPISAEGSLTADGKQSKWGLTGNLWVGSDFKQIKIDTLTTELEGVSEQFRSISLNGDLDMQLDNDATRLNHKGVLKLNGQPVNLDLKSAFGDLTELNATLSANRIELAGLMASTGTPKQAKSSQDMDLSPVANFLKGARIKGQLDVKEFVLKNATFTDVSANLSNQGAKLILNPFKANAFQGHVETVASVNFAANPLALAVQPQFESIQIGDLLAAFFEVEKLSGLGELDLDMKTQGAGVKQMLQNLNGTGKLELSDGSFNGIDVAKLIETGLTLQALNKENYSGKTSFANLSSSIRANKGLIELPDFNLNSPLFDLVGKASTDANKETVSGKFQLMLKGRLKEAMENKYPKLKAKALPFELKGTWAEPSASIDIEALLKAQYQDKVDEKKKELEDKAKEELEDKLGDIFKRKKDN
ncbi:AsmA family protein [Kangiella sediminilitoris]|uniref:AsmA family protein n=1 Tax=Kangiella sediminilitoris TaxID=1144748 RepID=A0A1B3BCZ5_9GAMM|nr:AsmA family protein [Kangiella sediminilitoris]AOE50645.1 AsmA family protein [Kangiella sediminilitoris]